MLKGHVLYSAAREFGERIAPVEAAIDNAITMQAELIAAAPRARLKAGLPASVGHQALVRLMAAMNATVAARGEFLSAHEEFSMVRDELRIPVTALGSSQGCPDASANLSPRLVEAA